MTLDSMLTFSQGLGVEVPDVLPTPLPPRITPPNSTHETHTRDGWGALCHPLRLSARCGPNLSCFLSVFLFSWMGSEGFRFTFWGLGVRPCSPKIAVVRNRPQLSATVRNGLRSGLQSVSSELVTRQLFWLVQRCRCLCLRAIDVWRCRCHGVCRGGVCVHSLGRRSCNDVVRSVAPRECQARASYKGVKKSCLTLLRNTFLGLFHLTRLFDTLVVHFCWALIRGAFFLTRLLGQSCGALLLDTLVGHSYLTLLLWNALTWRSCKTLLHDTLVGHSCLTPHFDTFVGYSYPTLLWDTLAGHFCRTPLLDTLVGGLSWHSCKALLLGTFVGRSHLARYLDTFCGAFFLDTLVGHSYLTLLCQTLACDFYLTLTLLWDKLLLHCTYPSRFIIQIIMGGLGNAWIICSVQQL